jgi:hypothetical protein
MMKRFRLNSCLASVVAGALLMALVVLGVLGVNRVSAADPTPQGIASYIGVSLLQYNGATAAANGVPLLAPQYALADCYNNVSFANAVTTQTVVLKIQSSQDGVNFIDTLTLTDTAATTSTITEMARIVLYGSYTRANLTSVLTTTNPITGSMLCKFTNQSR